METSSINVIPPRASNVNMDHQILAKELLFFVLLLSVNSIRVRGERNEVATSEQVKPVQEFVEESADEDQFSLQSTTTTESTTTIETYRKLALSISDKNDTSHSREFKPSLHLGEIKESRISASPFNKFHHIKFDNGVDRDSYHEQLKDFQIVFQPIHQSIQTDQQKNFQQNVFESTAQYSEENNKQEVEQNNYVKFQDDSLDASGYQYDRYLVDPSFHQQLVHPTTESVATQYHLVDQQVFQNLEKPVYGQGTSAYSGKPTKFQGEALKHEVAGLSSVDTLKAPQYVGFYDHQVHRPGLQDFDFTRRPSNGVVYVQESAFLRTRKFPYPIYQPPVEYHQAEFIDGGHPNYPLKKRISPWKKILHLIGAFLPLGLLVAALTPNVVKVNNSTDPSIVLSKWRVADLPVEHKQARLRDARRNVCEERSICEMILAGGDAYSMALQNVLWNLSTRTSTVVAKETGLQEIFEAVKKKDCSHIVC